MIIEMTQDGDGAWKYHDNTQAELCMTVMALTGWEITGFDDWINTDSHWKNSEFEGKKNRDELIELRHRLTRTFHDYNHDNYVIELEAQRLFAVAQWIASHVAGYKIARKDKDRSDKAREVSRLPRPNAKSQFKVAVIAAMRPHKLDDQQFKSFMSMWRQGAIHGLTVKTVDNSENYMITDENGNLGEQSYKWTTLEAMYSQATNS